MKDMRRFLIILAVAGLALGLAACSSSSKSSGSGAAASVDKITIQNTEFVNGDKVTAKAGATVSIENKDSFAHTVTSDDNAWTSVSVDANANPTFTAPTKPGVYKFHCNIHSNMHGILTVT
jgi:plastocyanin